MKGPFRKDFEACEMGKLKAVCVRPFWFTG